MLAHGICIMEVAIYCGARVEKAMFVSKGGAAHQYACVQSTGEEGCSWRMKLVYQALQHSHTHIHTHART